MRLLHLTFLVTLIWGAALSHAQEPKVGPDGSEGPFGLIFGQTAESIPFKLVSALSFKADNSPSPASLDGYAYALHSMKESCAREARDVDYAVPKSWKGNIASLFGDKVRPTVASKIKHNSLKLDLGLSGTLSGGIYSAPILEKDRLVCLAFFKDRLFLVFTSLDQLSDVDAEVEVGLSKKYGEPRLYGRNGYYHKTWELEGSKLQIQRRCCSGRLMGELAYNYFPVKTDEIKALVAEYLAAENATAKKSPF